MLRATDIQQILIQSNSMERVQQAQQQHADMQQRYFSVQLSEERKNLKETVKTTQETAKSKIKNKEEEEKQQKRENREDTYSGKAEMAHEKDTSEKIEHDRIDHGGLIDIKV